MNALKKKLNKNGGFTLVEMLIVVAIIAILIAVSIPLIDSALESANDATDQANERAAKALATMVVMGVGDSDVTIADLDTGADPAGKGAFYDAEKGELVKIETNVATDKANVKAYGKCTNGDADHNAEKFVGKAVGTGVSHAAGSGSIIQITYTAADGLTYAWIAK